MFEMDYDNDVNNIKKNIAKFNSKEETKNFIIKTAQDIAKHELGNMSSTTKEKLYIKDLINEAGIKYINNKENFNKLFN